MVSFNVVYEIRIGSWKQIGSTKSLEKRMKDHLYHLEKGNHSNSQMQNVYNKYKDFSYKVISEHPTREDAYYAEQVLLDIYYKKEGYLMQNPKATKPPTFSGYKDSIKAKEHKERMSGENNPSKSLEARKKISQSKMGNNNPMKIPEVVEKRLNKVKGMYVGYNNPSAKLYLDTRNNNTYKTRLEAVKFLGKSLSTIKRLIKKQIIIEIKNKI